MKEEIGDGVKEGTERTGVYLPPLQLKNQKAMEGAKQLKSELLVLLVRLQ